MIFLLQGHAVGESPLSHLTSREKTAWLGRRLARRNGVTIFISFEIPHERKFDYLFRLLSSFIRLDLKPQLLPRFATAFWETECDCCDQFVVGVCTTRV